MRLSAGCGDRKLRILLGARAMQSRDQITRQERTVRRRAQYPLNVRPGGRGPVEGSENTGQRSGKILHGVGDDGKTETCEPRRIAVGIENEPVALRPQPRDHPLEDGPAGDLPHRLVAAAHPPC